MNANTTKQLLKYAFVGGTATVIDFSLLFLLTEYLQVYYVISASIAIAIALMYNYFLCITWVFDKRTLNRTAEITIFIIIALTGIALNGTIIYLLTEYIKFYYILSKVFSTAIVFLWNFMARKYILFR